METNVADFFPKYPSIRSVEANPLLDPYDGDFYSSIFLKKEFNDVRLEPDEPIPEEPGQPFRHQVIIARFLSSHTLYDHLVIVHEPGTGKTCTAAGAIEQVRREGKSSYPMLGAMVFTTGPDQIANFEQELVYKCTAGQYIPEEEEMLRDTTVKRRVSRLVGEFYQFHTYQTFAKKVMAMSDEQIRKQYSKRVIVVDEVHHLREETSDPKVYGAFWRFLHVVERCKVILMSGTPMKDSVEEASSVMNLVLPIEEQLPTGKAFISKYFETSRSGVSALGPKTKDSDYPILSIRPDMEDSLKRAFRGRVSYLRAMQSQARPVFMGDQMGDSMKHFRVVPSIMSDFQSQAYADAFRRDMETKIVDGKKRRIGVFTMASEASLFVYPDGSYGSVGFKKYMKELKQERYTLGPELDKELGRAGMSTEERLAVVQKYSCKYADTIRQLIRARNEGKSSFVYCNVVKGSGAILFSSLLRKFGFSRATGGEEMGDERPRYALFTGTGKGSVQQVKRLLARFNSSDNAHGQIISVVIGSRVASEGFSLLNVQTETILTPFWNYSETVQAIARGLRAGSHRQLIQEQGEVKVEIYQRVSMPNDSFLPKPVPSLDLQMYRVSEIKDVNIKGVERLMRESAIDCALTFKRNYIPNGTPRECDYMACEYKCDGVSNELIENPDPPLDFSTYQLYYAEPEIRRVQSAVYSAFSNTFSASLTVLSELALSTPPFVILSSLNQIVDRDMPLLDKYGFASYVREEGNMYFLVDSVAVVGGSASTYYASNPIIYSGKDFVTILNNLQESAVARVQKITDAKNPTEFATTVGKLSKSVQEEIIEGAVLANKLKSTTNILVRNLALSHYRNYYKDINGTIVSSFLQSTQSGPLRCLAPKNTKWTNCPPELEEAHNKQKEDIISDLERNPYGVYGLYRVGPDGKEFFCIKEAEQEGTIEDGRKKPKGLNCSSWSVPKLLTLVIDTLKIEPPASFEPGDVNVDAVLAKSKYEVPEAGIDSATARRALYWTKQTRPFMCKVVKDWFATSNMLIEDERCAKH